MLTTSSPSLRHGARLLTHRSPLTSRVQVIAEVRDSKARQFLAQLPVTVATRSPSVEALAAVTAFAKATGDYAALSLNDLRVRRSSPPVLCCAECAAGARANLHARR